MLVRMNMISQKDEYLVHIQQQQHYVPICKKMDSKHEFL